MAHLEQLTFIKTVVEVLNFKKDISIIEIGSYDVSGTIRSFFNTKNYIGVDLIDGPGVDVIASGDRVDLPSDAYDLVVSCECFEHNPLWVETFNNMYRMCSPGGIVLITCASTGRVEHGTARSNLDWSPGTKAEGWDYYKNLSKKDFMKSFDLNKMFENYIFLNNKRTCDLYFLGMKRNDIFKQSLYINIFERNNLIFKYQENLKNAYSLKFKSSKNTKIIRFFLFLPYLTLLPLKIIKYLPENIFQKLAIPYGKFDKKWKFSLKKKLSKL